MASALVVNEKADRFFHDTFLVEEDSTPGGAISLAVLASPRLPSS